MSTYKTTSPTAITVTVPTSAVSPTTKVTPTIRTSTPLVIPTTVYPSTTTVTANTPTQSPTTTPTISPSATPVITSTPTATAPTTTPTVSPSATAATTIRTTGEATVVRVIDGDTIVVSIAGKTYDVRYIGVNTPETKDPNKPVEYYGPEASTKHKELVEGKIVRLEKDVSEYYKDGRLLRYVYVGNLFINAELVRLGYARATPYPPDTKYQSLFSSLEQEAKEKLLGIWAPLWSLQIVSVTSPVKAGASAKLVAKTYPGAACTIEAYYKSGISTASGLVKKSADAEGNVSWTWQTSSNTTPGSYKIVVKASLGNEMKSQEIYFTVQ